MRSLTLATDIARETGVLILDRDADTDLAVQTKSTDTDVVTAKDTAAERLIREPARQGTARRRLPR